MNPRTLNASRLDPTKGGSRRLGLAVAAVLTAGALVGGTAALASADSSPSPSSSTSGSAAANGAGDRSTTCSVTGPGRAPHSHTPVTGDEAQKVIDAVTAKDSAATIEKVMKDEDGSYDAVGTKDGSPVMFDVSADLATVTERTMPAGGRGGPGALDGPGGHHDGDGPDAGTGTGSGSTGGATSSSDPTAANGTSSTT